MVNPGNPGPQALPPSCPLLGRRAQEKDKGLFSYLAMARFSVGCTASPGDINAASSILV